MCKKLMYFYLTHPKLDWLKEVELNPYASDWKFTKLEIFLYALFIMPLVLIAKLENTYQCIEIISFISAIAFLLAFISEIKMTPADIECGLMKPLLCIELFLIKVVMVVILIRGILCLTT